jgi:hypothetical protein
MMNIKTLNIYLTIGIHLLRTLCPDDPPEAAELLD